MQREARISSFYTFTTESETGEATGEPLGAQWVAGDSLIFKAKNKL